MGDTTQLPTSMDNDQPISIPHTSVSSGNAPAPSQADEAVSTPTPVVVSGGESADDQRAAGPEAVDPAPAAPAERQQAVPPPPAPGPGSEAAGVSGDDVVSWTAAEFVAHPKTTKWYLSLGGTTVAITLIVWFVTRDIFATVIVAIGMVLFGVYARRKPRQQRYAVDGSGLTIGEHHYPFSEFRSFSINPEGELSSVEFTPLKRFALYTAAYFAPSDEERIVTVLSNHLPMEEPSNDFTDRLMRSLHF